jgi:hypothetical protein
MPQNTALADGVRFFPRSGAKYFGVQTCFINNT